MLRYILKRLLLMIPVLLSVSLVIFTMLYFTPGNPAELLLPVEASEADIAAMEQKLGLNDPFFIRYFNYVKNILQKGDFGVSYTTKRPVTEEILIRFPTTVQLALASTIVSVALGVMTGIISATRQYSIFDNIAVGVSMIGVSMPNFWQGMINILIFSVALGWLPASGFGGFQYWILPAVTIGSSSAATVMRMTRSSMLEVIRQDYITTARAKGQTEHVIRYRHALKNALIPVITVAGISFGNLLGGAVVTEAIFSIPGMGKLIVDSINVRNYPMVQGCVLFLALTFSFVNLGVDLLYAFVDPRIKSQFSAGKKLFARKSRPEEDE
jgi:peptide/nickel transport system permease protein